MNRRARWLLLAPFALVALVAVVFAANWFMPAPLEEERSFIVPDGASLTTIAGKLEKEGFIDSASRFLIGAKLFGGSRPIKAGEFLVPAHGSGNEILTILQGDEVIRRFVTIPEGMPSIMVHERLMAQPMLTGDIPIPAEGSVLPESYDFERGESREAVLRRMQTAMTRTLAEAWAKRAPGIAVGTPREALVLASIVEKETGKPSERRMVAGLYSNRLKKNMLLQADPTIIYPITRGKPLGRRIRQSEIQAINGYNTYTMTGLPQGPITNPGKASIEAVLNPAKTGALYMVADGTGGHQFSTTLEQHNAAVEKWFAIRRARGEM